MLAVLPALALLCAGVFAETLPSWQQLATDAGTDKVSAHGYQHMYTELLEPHRGTPLKFLEIGLGCNTTTGPGKSFALWNAYFQHVNTSINYIEIDGECVAQHNFKPRNGKVFIGSQHDEAFLVETARKLNSTGGLDVLVDDGGHSMRLIMTTFKHLWPIMKPGGVYIVEDLFFAYWERMGGHKAAERYSPTRRSTITFPDMINFMIDSIVCDFTHEECQLPSGVPRIDDVGAVYCYHRACAIRKAWADMPSRCTDCPLYFG